MSRKKQVLILYQYSHDRRSSRQEKFVRETENILNGATVQGLDIEAARLSRSGNPAADRTVYSEYVRAVNKYDFAIALFTVDQRPASTAGNLWFEVGYWYAMRGGDSLLIVQHLTGSRADSLVNIPSNLRGIAYRTARSASEVKDAFSDFLKDAGLPFSRRRAVEDFGTLMLNCGWIDSEKEDIKITEMMTKPHLLAKFSDEKVLSVETNIKRVIDGEQPLGLTFCFSVAGFEHDDKSFTYRHILGAGRLRQKQLSELRRIISEATPDKDGIPGLFEISDLRVHADKQVAKIDLKSTDSSDNSWRFSYECFWANAVPGPYTIEFKIKSVFFERHAWYTYKAPWCISKRFSVSLEAHKQHDCFCEVWPSQDGKTATRPVQVGNRYKSQVSLEGPVFAGSVVRWVFHP